MQDSFDLSLSEEELRSIGVTDGVTLESIIANMIKNGNNARSPILGSASEVHFRNQMAKHGAVIVEKILDHNIRKRYDFEVLFEDGELFTYENKIATGSGKHRSVRVGFSDSRNVILPSGDTWKTHARHIDQAFDFLSISMVRLTGNWSDFVYFPFSQIQHIDTSRKEFQKYDKRDREWIEENYLQLSIRVPLDSARPFSDQPR